MREWFIFIKEMFMFIFMHKIEILHDAPTAQGCSKTWVKLDELTLGTISPWGNTYYAYLHIKKYSSLYSCIGNRFILTPWQYILIRAYKIRKSTKQKDVK